MRNDKYLFEYSTKTEIYIREAAYWPENDYDSVYKAMSILDEKPELESVTIYKQSGMYWTDAAMITRHSIIPLTGKRLVKYCKGDYEYINE